MADHALGICAVISMLERLAGLLGATNSDDRAKQEAASCTDCGSVTGIAGYASQQSAGSATVPVPRTALFRPLDAVFCDDVEPVCVCA